MILKNKIISGYNYSSTPNLATIGSLISWYDYRRGVDFRVISGVNRVTSINDLSPNGFSLVGNTSNRAVLESDHITATAGLARYISTPSGVLTPLHNGNPILSFAVIDYSNPSNANVGIIEFIDTGTGTGTAGFRFAITTSTKSINTQYFNNAGTTLGAQGTTAIEDNQYRLVMYVYYGLNAKSNNRELNYGTSTVSATFNPTFGTNNPTRLTSAFSNQIKIKTWGAYDLSGKTVSEIDSFKDLFIATLKRDPEYSSLITI
jgi:hypothetical protein